MKTNFVLRWMPKISIFLIFITDSLNLFSQNYYSQETYMRANNCNCYLLMPKDGYGAFSWSGNCYNGYCDGYGIATYYDFEGKYAGKFEGYCSKGSRGGFGTKYYPEGNIRYQGFYSNDVWVNEEPYSYADNFLKNVIIDSLLMGGVNRNCSIIQSIFSNSGELKKICYYISCNGQYDNSNFYELTLVIQPNSSSPVHFENVNDNARTLIALKALIWGVKLYNWFSKQLNNDR